MTVLDWKYSIPVNQRNVLSFFSEYGVTYSLSEGVLNTLSNHIQMAPVQIPKPKSDKQRKASVETLSQFVIRQFDADGKFIAEHESIQRAAIASGVSEKSIYNTVYGTRKTGGGYIWRECSRGSEVADVVPTKSLENTGLAKRILQFSKDGSFIAEHLSIGQAAKTIGVNRRSISDVLSGAQKTAGGYIWKYKEGDQ